MSYQAEHRDGNVIAWTDDTRQCQNRACRRAIAAGRPVHITPAHTDPRAANVTLALTGYHYATRDEALAALEQAWATAGEVSNAADRDAAYARNVPVKVRHDGSYR